MTIRNTIKKSFRNMFRSSIPIGDIKPGDLIELDSIESGDVYQDLLFLDAEESEPAVVQLPTEILILHIEESKYGDDTVHMIGLIKGDVVYLNIPIFEGGEPVMLYGYLNKAVSA